MTRPPQMSAAGPTVHELQALARQASRPQRNRHSRLSRAARLHLIDVLSRWGGSGLALIAGVTIFIAVIAGRGYPLRAAVWGIIMLAALQVCREQRKRFRSGERIAARPFRWRANYTASLAALSAAFGAGALITAPPGASAELAFQSLALILAAGLGAGIAHAAHGPSAAAATTPATAFIFLGAWRTAGLEPAVLTVGALTITGAATLWLFNRFLRQRAARRFPRTGAMRRDISRMLDSGADDEDVSEQGALA